MNILVIPTSYPSFYAPTTNLFIREQVEALTNLGNCVSVLHVIKEPTVYLLKRINYSVKRIEENGYIRFETHQKTFLENKFPRLNRYFFVKRMTKLIRYFLMNNKKPDVIYAHFSCWAGFAACKIAKQYNIPVVTIEHFSGFMQKPADINKVLLKDLKFVIDNSKKFICVSHNLKTNICDELCHTTKELAVIPNLIDPIFTFQKREKKDYFVFCTIANLNHRKRVKELVENFILTFDAKDKVSLIIGGYGEKFEEIKELISFHNRDQQIILVGRVNRTDTFNIYKYSDCFVLPSAFETFGLVYREAMAVGRPIITTNHGGFDLDEWSDDNGILIEVDDWENLRQSMKKIISDYSKYNLECISSNCLEYCSSRNVALKIESVLREACYEE